MLHTKYTDEEERESLKSNRNHNHNHNRNRNRNHNSNEHIDYVDYLAQLSESENGDNVAAQPAHASYLDTLRGFSFSVYTTYIIFVEYMKFLFNINSKNNCIKSIARRLAKQNMFYIKLFQGFATNKNLVNDDLSKFFLNYTDQVPYHDSEYDINELKALEAIELNPNNMSPPLRDETKEAHCAYGKPLRLVIDDNYKPYKSGMMSIIFKGHIGTKPVIIKCLRKNIYKRFNKAVKSILGFAHFTRYIPKLNNYNIENVVLENAVSIKEQIDFTTELGYLVSFYNKWKDVKYIETPYPYVEYTKSNENIIVMEYLTGHKINDVNKEDMDGFARSFAKFNTKCVFYDRLYHADIHPGNVLFKRLPKTLPEGVSPAVDKNGIRNDVEYVVSVLDYGIVGKLNKKEQSDVFELVKNTHQKNYIAAADIIINDFSELKNGAETQTNSDSYKHLKKGMNKILNIISQDSKFLGVNELCEINTILQLNDMKFKGSLYKVLLALAISDSVGHKIYNKKTYMAHFIEVFVEMFGLGL